MDRIGPIPMVNDNDSLFPKQEQHWKNEVVSRLQDHRARRQKSSEDDPVELDFSGSGRRLARSNENTPAGQDRRRKRSLPTASDGLHPASPDEFEGEYLHAKAARREEAGASSQPKVIRFPASLPEHELLAEHMPFGTMGEPETPRIFDAECGETGGREEWSDSSPRSPRAAFVPEQMQLLPSFEDIQLEDTGYQISGNMELLPRPAPLRQRAIATAIDASVVLTGTLVFGITFDHLAGTLPQSRLAMLFALSVAGALWLLFQYLFLVHSEGTPGMRLAELELTTFEGKPPSVTRRRRRALASALSAFSMGFGYGWALIDEDQLGWHDRISQTLVRGRSPYPNGSNDPSLHD
jgi:uncharacterized RDD family membrane protein YckC